MSRFYFGGESGSVSSLDDEDNLPYPKALPRSDFLTSGFDAATYLSTLSDRHQTLEDLRSDLRERSQALSKELLDLVNTNYEHFLSLGSNLKGGEEKAEDVRVGLLGFRRGVEDVRGKVRDRGREVEELLGERKGVSGQISLGRKLLEVDARLEELEEKLMVASLGHEVNGVDEDVWSESEDDEDDGDGLAIEGRPEGTNIKKLQRLVLDCRYVEHLLAIIGPDHPFIVAQGARMIRVRNTILLDLIASLKQAKEMGEAGNPRLIKIMSIYQDLGAGVDAIQVLKDMKIR
jgi:hypothetical protein